MQNSGFGQTFVVLYSIQVLKEVYTVNVALNKSGKYCDIHEMSKLIFDGDTNYQNSDKFHSMCFNSMHTFLIIDLVEMYSVQHVVVYHGTENSRAQLDFFKVLFNEYTPSNEKHRELCSEYPFVAQTPGQGLRMNCKPSGKLFSEVQLESKFNRGLDIAEIELHTLAKGLPTSRNVLIHRGCFEVFGSLTTVLNFVECQQMCLKEGYSFIGIKADRYCGCDDNLDAGNEVSLEACDHQCDDDSGYCGGEHGYSVYIVKPPLPWYDGCYNSPDGYEDRTTTIRGVMTPLKCLRHCDGHRYAKLQRGDYCFCDDDTLPENTKVSSKGCNAVCTGDTKITCGGWVQVAVYSTCRQGANSRLTCSQLFQCEDNSPHDVFGTCSLCRPGYTGGHCFELVNKTESRNISLPGDDDEEEEEDDFDLFWPFIDAKLKEYLPFLLPWLSLMLLGVILFCLSSRSRSESSAGDRLTRFGKVSVVTI